MVTFPAWQAKVNSLEAYEESKRNVWDMLVLLDAHTRSDEKKQKKKKALLAFGTRFCALQSENFQVIIVTLSLLVGMEMHAVLIARNYQHGAKTCQFCLRGMLLLKNLTRHDRVGLSYVE